jgi:hypothetical protein
VLAGIRAAPATALRAAAVVMPFVAVAGCLLAWERVEVTASGQTQAHVLDGFHGSGLAACIGAALALLMLADGLLRPRPSQVRLAGATVAGVLLAIGAALFTATGGYRPAGGDGYSVTVQPGLYLAGVAGLLLVVSAAAQAGWRRAGSRSPASSG